jgi:hypothetical protein
MKKHNSVSEEEWKWKWQLAFAHIQLDFVRLIEAFPNGCLVQEFARVFDEVSREQQMSETFFHALVFVEIVSESSVQQMECVI